jgi:capsular polysaccharide biosynthesis protein
MIGLFITFFLEYNNRNIITGADVEKYLGMNLIGTIPEYTREMKRNVQL